MADATEPRLAVSSTDGAELKPLARQIERGQCILFLGPGAATVPGESPERPVSVELSELLARDPEVTQIPGLDRRDLRHVSQILYEKTRNLTSIQETVVDFYATRSAMTGRFHEDVAALPFTFCLTTTPDDFLYNAFSRIGKRPSRHFYNFRGGRASKPVEAPSVERPLIYHLYGYPDEPDSLVVTENDLIDFLTSVVSKAPPLAEAVRAELAKPATNCLFADLGFKNWYLRILLRSLSFFGHQDSSVALEDADFFERSEIHQTTLYFSASQAIQFRKQSLHEFARQLRAAYGSIAKKKVTAELVPTGAPLVFVSYTSEDREAVERLTLQLNRGGIAVWQDSQSLRVGDRWEQALVDIISRADYVIVLQTPAMARRVESYVGREVHEALKRSNRILHGFRFILPLTLETTDKLLELREFQSIDVGTDGGVQSLIATIHDDWAGRAKKRVAGSGAGGA
jgi:hypothetical protein